MIGMNFELSPEGQRMLGTFQKLRKENVAPRALKHDKAATFPVDTFQDLHSAKLLELSIPKEYGGRDMRLHKEFLVEVMATEELSKACSATGQAFHNHSSALEVITALGTAEQKQRFFGEVVAQGAVTGGWASERTGKTLYDLKTRATPVDGGYLVNGEKFFSTNSGGARWGMLFIPPDGRSLNEFLIFIIPMDAPGVSHLHDWNPLGQRATTNRSQLDLDQVLEHFEVSSVQGLIDMYTKVAGKSVTVREAARLHGQSVSLPQIVGTPEQVADQLEDYYDHAGGDGFMLTAIYSPGAIEEFVDLVVPVLQKRGRLREDYRGGTLREHLLQDE